MKRIILLSMALLLVVCGIACQKQEPERAAIDGKYVYFSGRSVGVYAEYEIDTVNNTYSIRGVNLFDGSDPVEVGGGKLNIIGENVVQTDDGLTFALNEDGSLNVENGAATFPRVIEPKEDTEVKQNPIATITMADGQTMQLELYPAIAPETVANFVTLANSGFYDGLTFHRIYAGFMIQGGCPKGDGTGEPGYRIKGEFAANGFIQNNLAHTRGVISMARGGYSYNSAGCQFFIMHADYPSLNAQYAAFGKLIEGYDTLDSIAATPVTANAYGEVSTPLEDVVIASIRVETFGVDYSNGFTKL